MSDENGAADFVAPAVSALDQGAQDLVFFPHWEPRKTPRRWAYGPHSA